MTTAAWVIIGLVIAVTSVAPAVIIWIARRADGAPKRDDPPDTRP